MKNKKFILVAICILVLTGCNSRNNTNTNKKNPEPKTIIEEKKSSLKMNTIYYDSSKDYYEAMTPVENPEEWMDYSEPGLVYYKFYEDGTVEYNESMCNHYLLIKGTYENYFKDDIEYLKINLNYMNNDTEWELQVVSENEIKNSGELPDYICEFPTEFKALNE